MSFSLRDNTKRDSFDERICDDLSEVILQYLPIEVKFRFESVSKQFQRTIFEKQYKLKIKDSTHLESILKKCPKINSIDFKSISYEDGERVVELIDKYCNNLVEISGNLNITERAMKELVQKFSLNSFTLKDMNANFSLSLLISSLPAIKELHFKQSTDFLTSIKNDEFYCYIESNTLKNLKTASISLSYS